MATGEMKDYERDKDDPLRFAWQMREENDEFLHRQRWWWWCHYQNGTLKNMRQLEAQRLSCEAEQVVDELVRQMGYRTQMTTHKCPFDLWVQDEAGRAIKVEVKISRFHPLKKVAVVTSVTCVTTTRPTCWFSSPVTARIGLL